MQIDYHVKDQKNKQQAVRQQFMDINFGMQDFYADFFNYQMNTCTWRNFVNKQILQTYHRLAIEKQLKEAKKAEKDLKD